MKTIRFMFLLFMVMACSACATTHMINVPEENQNIERTLYQQKAIVDGIAEERVDLYKSAVDLKVAGKITAKQFADYRKFDGEKMYPGIIAAYKACLKTREDIDNGRNTDAGWLRSKVDVIRTLISQMRKML